MPRPARIAFVRTPAAAPRVCHLVVRPGGFLRHLDWRKTRLWAQDAPCAIMSPMSALPQTRLDAEEFLTWSLGRPGRYELFGGVVVAQAAERVAHAALKLEVCVALNDAIRGKGAACHALPDGVAVKIDANTVYEPDAQVYCGPKLPGNALLVENPVIVVEVLSPSTGRYDETHKLAGYFSLASVQHFLIFDPDECLLVHHRRLDGEKLLTRILREGVVTLDPPGLEFDLARLYAGQD